MPFLSRRYGAPDTPCRALKEMALKKMTTGKKLTFDEMKLIFGDAGSD